MAVLLTLLTLSPVLRAGPVKLHVAGGSNPGSGVSATVSTTAFAAGSGNLIVVFASQRTSGLISASVSDTAGNTYLPVASAAVGATGSCGMWYAKNIAGNAANVVTVAFSAPAGQAAVSATEYSGLDQTAPLDLSATGTAAGANGVLSGAFTAAAGELMVAGAAAASSGNTFSPGAGFSVEGQDPGGFEAVEDQVTGSAQSRATASMSAGGSTDWGMVVATFRAPDTGSYSFQRPIVINHDKVGASDASDFTVVIAGTYPYLATAANSGKVRRTAACGPNAITCPLDLIFTSDSACKFLLNWEFESYSAATGEMTVWVRVPQISHLSDTTIYECYGNAAESLFRGGAAGAAWDQNYQLVQHFGTPTVLSTGDSSVNGNMVVPTNAAAAAGQIGGGVFLSGTSTSFLSVNNCSCLDSTTGTWSGWIRTSASVAAMYPLLWSRADGGGSRSGISLFLSAYTGQVRVQLQGAAGTVLDLRGGVALNDGTWHHIAFTFAANGPASLFADGVAVATGTPVTGWSFNGQVLRTGVGLDAFWTPLNGVVDEFEVSGSARSADWILAAYNNQNSPSTFYVVGAETGQRATTPAKGGSQPVLG